MELIILSGSFTSLSLWLLALTIPSPHSNSTSKSSLRLVRSIPGLGPHQYLHLSPTFDAAYATTWTLPPALHAFSIPSFEYIGPAPITATSSYITVRDKWMYSAGGPTGEVHRLPFPDPVKEQEFLFVPEEELATTDKTRVALRSGSHAIEFSEGDVTRAYVPVLGTDAVHVYVVDSATGLLKEETILKTPKGSGPRHVKVHPNGGILYAVTEHDNTVLTYAIPSLELLSSHTLYPSLTSAFSPEIPLSHTTFRGDTLMLSPDGKTLFTTTRGGTPATRGWLAAFPLTSSGSVASQDGITYWETPTSGGKANALDIMAHPAAEGKVLLVLTDDDPATRSVEDLKPALYVLEYSGFGSLAIMASYTDIALQGTSHAVFVPGMNVEDAGRHDEL